MATEKDFRVTTERVWAYPVDSPRFHIRASTADWSINIETPMKISARDDSREPEALASAIVIAEQWLNDQDV